jgi:signal transduction histidine kinase
MAERIEAIGGTLDVGPTPSGFRVEATVPRGAARTDGDEQEAS